MLIILSIADRIKDYSLQRIKGGVGGWGGEMLIPIQSTLIRIFIALVLLLVLLTPLK